MRTAWRVRASSGLEPTSTSWLHTCTVQTSAALPAVHARDSLHVYVCAWHSILSAPACRSTLDADVDLRPYRCTCAPQPERPSARAYCYCYIVLPVRSGRALFVQKSAMKIYYNVQVTCAKCSQRARCGPAACRSQQSSLYSNQTPTSQTLSTEFECAATSCNMIVQKSKNQGVGRLPAISQLATAGSHKSRR